MLIKMLFKRDAERERNLKSLPAESTEAARHEGNDISVLQLAEGRRQIYERIAQGSALAEAEENARRKWR